jgi:thiamine-phosphate pyrophosphorylase
VSHLNSVAGSLPRALLKKPILCYVTDRLSLPASSEDARRGLLLERMQSLSAAGLDWIQIREKDLSGRVVSALTRDALSRISMHEDSAQRATRVIVNDRLDVALAEGAGGVHLGGNSLPVAEASRLLAANTHAQVPSGDFLVGVSCHSLEAATTAASRGADYIFFGPVFATPSKAQYGPPQGLERLREVCSSVAIPVLAIGGITLQNAPACLAAGARGIAAIRLFQEAPDAAAIIRALRS